MPVEEADSRLPWSHPTTFSIVKYIQRESILAEAAAWIILHIKHSFVCSTFRLPRVR